MQNYGHGLDRAHVDVMIVWPDKFPFAFFVFEIFFEWLGGLVIGDVEDWAMPFVKEHCENILEGFNSCDVLDARN